MNRDRPNDSPLDRLRRLLNQGRTVTLDGTSDRLGISRRHLRRLLRQLEDEGLRINERWEEGVKRFSLDPASRTVGGAVDLEEDELYALIVSAFAARSVLGPTPLEDGLASAVETLLAAAGPVYSFEPGWQEEVWHFDEGATSPIDPDRFETIVRAANRCERLDITYFSASSRQETRRRIEPLVIAEQGGSWLLTAYCHRAEDLRDFALPGIRSAEPDGTYFQRPADFDPDEHFSGRFRALKGGGSHRVVLEVAPDKAPYFRRKTYHPTQEINADTGDSHIEVTFEVSSFHDIAAFIRSWGPGVRAVHPPRLAERLKREANEVAASYASSGGSGSDVSGSGVSGSDVSGSDVSGDA
jgi:predicted DNA-binding transcriptional regulator YafY